MEDDGQNGGEKGKAEEDEGGCKGDKGKQDGGGGPEAGKLIDGLQGPDLKEKYPYQEGQGQGEAEEGHVQIIENETQGTDNNAGKTGKGQDNKEGQNPPLAPEKFGKKVVDGRLEKPAEGAEDQGADDHGGCKRGGAIGQIFRQAA